MKRCFKNIIVFTLILCTLLSTAIPAFAADAPSASFLDVSASDWCYKPIQSVVSAGIMSRFDDGTFRPSETMTVEEFNSALSLMQQSTLTLSPNIKKLSTAGVSSKTPITRQVAIKALLCTLGVNEPTPAVFLYNPFTDISIEHRSSNQKIDTPLYTYEDYILSAYHMGIINGDSGVFNAQDKLTRAEAAQLITKAMSIKNPKAPAIQEFKVDYNSSEEIEAWAMQELSSALLLFPENLREFIKAQGILFCMTPRHETNESYGGLYCEMSKTINLYTDNLMSFGLTRCATHEIGHFIYQELLPSSARRQIAEIFSDPTVVQSLANAIGYDYCKTNESEFFAEWVSYVYFMENGNCPADCEFSSVADILAPYLDANYLTPEAMMYLI